MKIHQLEHSHHQGKIHKYPVCFLAHDIELPLNIGSLFRIADALGIERVFLTGSTPIPPNKKIRKASRATEKHVPYTYEENPRNIINKLKSDEYIVISLEITSTSIDIRKLRISQDRKVCLILGSERSGICQELLDVSDITTHIPMQGHNSSMNIATACSIAAFEIIRNYLQ